MDKYNMIPFYAMEATLDRFEKTNKRLWIVLIMLVIMLVVTNGLWIWYESQFEEVVTTQEVQQDIESGDGDLNVIEIGDYYGEDKTDK